MKESERGKLDSLPCDPGGLLGIAAHLRRGKGQEGGRGRRPVSVGRLERARVALRKGP